MTDRREHAERRAYYRDTPERRDADAFYAIGDIAARLRVSDWQVRQWLEAGCFPNAKRFGPRLIRIPAADVEAFLAKSPILGEISQDSKFPFNKDTPESSIL